MFGGRSRSTTPASLISGKSPTAEQGIQVSGASTYKRDDKKVVHPIQPPGQQQRGGHYQQRERRDSRGEHSQVRNFLVVVAERKLLNLKSTNFCQKISCMSFYFCLYLLGFKTKNV